MIGKSFIHSLQTPWAVPCKFPFPSVHQLSAHFCGPAKAWFWSQCVWHSSSLQHSKHCPGPRLSKSPQCQQSALTAVQLQLWNGLLQGNTVIHPWSSLRHAGRPPLLIKPCKPGWDNTFLWHTYKKNAWHSRKKNEQWESIKSAKNLAVFILFPRGLGEILWWQAAKVGCKRRVLQINWKWNLIAEGFFFKIKQKTTQIALCYCDFRNYMWNEPNT